MDAHVCCSGTSLRSFTGIYVDASVFCSTARVDAQMKLCTMEFCLAWTKQLYVPCPQVLCALVLSVIVSF